jgi:hypothetical protein
LTGGNNVDPLTATNYLESTPFGMPDSAKTNGEEIPGPTKDSAQRLFIEGIDRFEPGQRTDAFLELEQNFSDSAWNRRAKTLANLAGSRRLLEK